MWMSRRASALYECNYTMSSECSHDPKEGLLDGILLFVALISHIPLLDHDSAHPLSLYVNIFADPFDEG